MNEIKPTSNLSAVARGALGTMAVHAALLILLGAVALFVLFTLSETASARAEAVVTLVAIGIVSLLRLCCLAPLLAGYGAIIGALLGRQQAQTGQASYGLGVLVAGGVHGLPLLAGMALWLRAGSFYAAWIGAGLYTAVAALAAGLVVTYLVRRNS